MSVNHLSISVSPKVGIQALRILGKNRSVTASFFLFLFSAIGVVNGVFLALYKLVVKRSPHTPWLVGLILLICLRVGVSSIYFFEKILSWDIVQVGMMANVLIGPTLVGALLHYFKSPRKSLFNIYFGTVVSLVLLFSFLYPFRDHVVWWDHTLRYYLHIILSIHLVWACLLYTSPSPRDS